MFERIGQLHLTKSLPQILLMKQVYFLDLLSEEFFDKARQHRYPIFEPFPFPHENLRIGKINLLDTQPHPFHQSKAPAP